MTIQVHLVERKTMTLLLQDENVMIDRLHEEDNIQMTIPAHQDENVNIIRHIIENTNTEMSLVLRNIEILLVDMMINVTEKDRRRRLLRHRLPLRLAIVK